MKIKSLESPEAVTHTHTHTHYVYQINNNNLNQANWLFNKAQKNDTLNKNKTEQGITIISLVVTVIILLILAGVAIGAISGDNGLISRTKQTVEESKKAEYQEGLDTIGLGVKLKTAGDNLNTAEYMDEYLEELNQEKTKEGSLFKESAIKRKNDETIRVETKEGYIYYVREDETIYVGKVGEVDEGNIAELRKADIIFSYSHNTWTNQDVEVTISLSETVQNKENYRLEYSRDNKNWSKYAEGTTITMTQNGKVYARTKDISGDIKLEGGYAEGEVTIIDKESPTPGTLIMKLGSAEGEIYTEGMVANKRVYIELINGTDNEGGSGHKTTVYNVEGPESYVNKTEPVTLIRNGTYTITVTTTDNVELTVSRTYTIEIYNNTEGETVDDVKGSVTGDEEEPTILKIAEEKVVVPPGFTVAEDSGKTVPEGIVIKDKQDNEWVWIPCYVQGGQNVKKENLPEEEQSTYTTEEAYANKKGIIKYERYAFTKNDWSLRQEKLSNGRITRWNTRATAYSYENLSTTSEEYISIQKYGGYYIGRYEAGIEDTSSSIVLVQKNKIAYSKNQTECITLSEGMTSLNGTDRSKLDGTKVFTKLCSSYSWDTAIKFIEKTHPDYGVNSKTNKGEIIDNTSDNYQGILNTGVCGSVCSIYDLGGNLLECTTETYTDPNATYTYGRVSMRGGYYNSSASYEPAGTRGNGGSGGFRPTLFIK